jgi:hypothetical protein
MSGYYETAQIALRALEQARLDANVARDWAVKERLNLQAEVNHLLEEAAKPAGFPPDWRDQFRAIYGADQLTVNRVINLIVAWQAAAKNHVEDPWYEGNLLEEPLASPPRDEPLYRTITGWLVAVGTGLVVLVVLMMAIAVGKELL